MSFFGARVIFLAQCHCDCRCAEFAVECHLLDQSAGRVAAGAGWPGRTEILRFRRWAWICHLGPFRVQASVKAPESWPPGQQGLRAGASLLGRNLDGNQIAGSTEHVLDMRISCFVMVENVRRGNVIAY